MKGCEGQRTEEYFHLNSLMDVTADTNALRERLKHSMLWRSAHPADSAVSLLTDWGEGQLGPKWRALMEDMSNRLPHLLQGDQGIPRATMSCCSSLCCYIHIQYVLRNIEVC